MENNINNGSTNYKKIENEQQFSSNNNNSINFFFQEPKKEKKEKTPIIIFSFIFILGVGLMFYPTVNNIINNSKHHYVIGNYDSKIGTTSNTLKKEMLQSAQEYNNHLNHTSIQDVFSTDKNSNDSQYDNLLNITNDGLMGYIEIPKINIKLPIYHSTSTEALEKGVGHLKGSSLPVGGLGTHTILAAHRGLPTSKLFSDLDKLEVGDKFYLSILDEKLAYQVDSINVVEPNQLDLLDIEYVVDPNVVRGLDYYDHTVFEIEAAVKDFGAQNVLGAGGRYNDLVKQLGGPEVPGIGFAMGLGRLMLAIEKEGIELPIDESIDAYVMYVSDTEKDYATTLVQELRMNGFKVDTEYTGRGLKGQFKQADRLNSRFLIILNDEDLKNNEIQVKNNKTKEDTKVDIDYLMYVLDEELNSDDECDCGCGCGDDCTCEDDCDCGCQDGKECTCGGNCHCHEEGEE